MQDYVVNCIQEKRNDRNRRRKVILWLSLLSVIVAGIVFWQLSVTGVTMSKTLLCDKTEHTHSSECYTLICENSDAGHEHGDGCYELTCEVPEHTHDADCYEVSLEDEAKDWTISASFVESKPSDDGSSIDWVYKNSESWNAGTETSVTEDGKIYVGNVWGHSTNKAKSSGNNKTVTVRVSYEYNGEIKHFDVNELRIDVPNIMKNCRERHIYAASISLNSSSIFKFENGSSVIYQDLIQYTYDGWYHSGERRISSMDKLSLYNVREIEAVKELKGYFDITYELESLGEGSYGTCELYRRGQFSDDCEHSHQSIINAVTLLRSFRTNGTKTEYGFVGNFAAGDGSGLQFSFYRLYIHPYARTLIELNKHGESARLGNYAKKQLEKNSEIKADDYYWTKWIITSKEYKAHHTELNDSNRQISLNDHNYYTKYSNGGLFKYHVTEGNYNMPYTSKQMYDLLPKDAVICSSTGMVLGEDAEVCDDGLKKVLLPSNIADVQNPEFWVMYKYVVYVGYPKSATTVGKNGEKVSKYLNQTVGNTAYYQIVGANGKDYSIKAKSEAFITETSGDGGGLSISYSKYARDKQYSINALLNGASATAYWEIPIDISSVPDDGIDIVITDKDIGLKKNEFDHKLYLLNDIERRVQTVSLPPLVDEGGNRVHAKISVSCTYSNGSVSTYTYLNEEQRPDGLNSAFLYNFRCWEYQNAPTSFEIKISEVYDKVQKFNVCTSTHLLPTDEVFSKLIEMGCDFKTEQNYYLTNSAKVSVYNHENPSVCYTPGLADKAAYLDANLEPTENGWAYWESDQAAAPKETNFRRIYANAKLQMFPTFCKSALVYSGCTDNYVDSSDDYFYNTYTMSASLKSSIQKAVYEISAFDSIWNDSIAPIDQNKKLADYTNVFRSFAMYDLLPQGVELVSDAEQMKTAANVVIDKNNFFKVLNAYSKEELSKEEVKNLIKDNLSVKVINNYKGTGRALIVATVNIPDKDCFVIINNGNWKAVSLNVPVKWRIAFDTIIKNNYQLNGFVNCVTAAITDGSTVYNENNAQGVSEKNMELYSDELKQAGYTNWRVAGHTCKLTYAGAMTQGILNQVRTSRVETYLPDKADEARQTDLDADYGYQVRLAVLSSKITNAKFTDTLECNRLDSEYGADEWSGKLSCIDMSNFSGSLGTDVPTAVFADSETGRQTALNWDADNMRFTVPEGKELGSGTLTIDLGNAQLLPNRYYSYFIHLNAPSKHCDGLTSNNAKISYQKLNNDVANSEVFNLTSNRVFTKLGYSLEKTGLQVEKVWDTGNAEAVELPESISFELLQNGKSIKSGTLTADDDWKSVITDLPVYDQDNGEKYEYTVKENAIEGYITLVEQLSEPNADGYPIMRITNVLIGRDYALKLIKTDDHGNRLEGAEFKLIDSSGTVVAKGTTDNNGELMLSASGKLLVGQAYKLAETKAPNGYKPLYSNEIAFTVSKTGEPLTVEYDTKDKIESSWDTDDTLVITVENKIQYELPESGGIGTYPFVIGGLLLMAAPMIYIYVRRKERGTVD